MAFEAISGRLGNSIFLLCVFIVFLFVTVSTPIAQYKGRGMVDGGANRISCVTYFGVKDDCTKNPYAITVGQAECSRVSQLYRAASAFGILSVAFSLAGVIVCALSILGYSVRIPLILLGVVCIITTLIPWAIMAAVYNHNFCGHLSAATVDPITGYVDHLPYGTVLKAYFKYSAGFGLFVAAWCIQIIGTVCLIVV